MLLLPLLLASSMDAASVSGVVLDHGKPVVQAVVWLEGPVRAEPRSAIVDQRKRAFSPHIQVVTVGSRVDFPNNDDVFHNVFAEFQAKRFDLGMYPKGTKKSVKFDKPGIVSVLCNVHAQMSAYIVVVDTPYFATTDAQGRFAVKDVEPHRYTLRAWHESGKTGSQPLQVDGAKNGLRVELAR